MRDDIDRVIDEAALELTAGAPDASLRANVVARITGGRSTISRHAWWIIAPMAAAAIAIALMLASSRDRAIVAPPAVAQRGVTIPNAASAVRPPASHTDDVRAEAVEEPAAAHAPAERNVPNPSEVAALAPAPLVVPSIEVAPIGGAPSIQLQQLEPIERIDLAPLEPEPEPEPEPRTKNQNPER